MTYAVGYFIYGINLDLEKVPAEFHDLITALEDEDAIETRYSGNGDGCLFIGVELDTIDECSNLGWASIVKVKDKLKAAMEPQSDAAKTFAGLLLDLDNALEEQPDDLDTAEAFGKWIKTKTPEVFLTWGSS